MERILSMPEQHKAFLAFIQSYARLISRAIRQACGQKYPTLQVDIEQEVYLKLWEAWTYNRCIDYPVSYLYKVALRTALAVLRTYTSTEFVDDAEVISVTNRARSKESTSTAEHAMILNEYLDQLSGEQARAIRAHLAGFTQREIAGLYGWSVSVTRHRIYRGLQALRAFAMQEVK
jgi:RNA polymerase sigma factor (sigma-70 family)